MQENFVETAPALAVAERSANPMNDLRQISASLALIATKRTSSLKKD